MIEQQGRVVARENGYATVELGASTGCSACDAGRGCGAGLFGRLLNRRPTPVRLSNAIGAQVGAAVSVGIPESVYLKLVVGLYLLPLMAALGGAAAGHWFAGLLDSGVALRDGVTLLAALFCGGVVLVFNRGWQAGLPGPSGLELLSLVGQPERDGCGIGTSSGGTASPGD